MRFAVALVLILLAINAQAKVVEKFKCQAGTPWISGYDVVLRAMVNDDRETGVIEVAGVTYETDYKVVGFNRRWNWGLQDDGSYSYAFLLQPGGSAFYFDFTNVGVGKSATSKQDFSCK